MNVTIICDVLGTPNNGTSIAAYNLIGYLKEAGHRVTVVCADADKKGMDGFVVLPTMNFGPLNAIVKANNVTLAKPVKKILTEAICHADVVHILMPLLLGSTAATIAKNAGIPITASFHAQAENVTAHISCMNAKAVNHLTYLAYYRFLYSKVDCVHYPTEFIKELFEKEIGRELPNRVISNGVNDRFFVPQEKKRLSDKFTILCMGRFSEEKSQQTLIEAVAQCPMKNNVKLYFAGTGPRKKKLVRLAKEKNVDADFKFYSREELLTVLHGADLYVHTAPIEIEAISCLEAIISGLVPVICNSDRSATRYFAVDENCLFRCGDSKDLAEKIAYFYHSPEKIEEYRLKYEKFREQYRQKECMQRMEQMLLETANKRLPENR